MYIRRFNEDLDELQYFVYCFLDTRKPGKYNVKKKKLD
jgi:hypothetical protein